MALVIAAASVTSSPMVAQDRAEALHRTEPPTTCTTEPDRYPLPGGAPKVQAWSARTLPQTWRAPSCVGWDGMQPTTLVLVLGSFDARDADAILDRIGKISGLTGLRYWSTTDRRWETLVLGSTALDGLQGRPRGDFTAQEMTTRRDLFFRERDNRSSDAVTYRMRVLENASDHIALTIANVSPVKKMLVTFFAPDDLQASYFITRLDRDRWGFMSLSAARATGIAGLGSSDESYVSRALAMFRQFADVN
ncbi:MAG: hypothetical protein JO021_23450 [Alphaproteobacteria bacterium]|nr:hypothetical protein [Alphaproteobacteria bacterium]